MSTCVRIRMFQVEETRSFRPKRGLLESESNDLKKTEVMAGPGACVEGTVSTPLAAAEKRGPGHVFCLPASLLSDQSHDRGLTKSLPSGKVHRSGFWPQ